MGTVDFSQCAVVSCFFPEIFYVYTIYTNGVTPCLTFQFFKMYFGKIFINIYVDLWFFLKSCVVFHCVDTLEFILPGFYWWTFRWWFFYHGHRKTLPPTIVCHTFVRGTRGKVDNGPMRRNCEGIYNRKCLVFKVIQLHLFSSIMTMVSRDRKQERKMWRLLSQQNLTIFMSPSFFSSLLFAENLHMG